MRSTPVNGPNPLVNAALRNVESDIFFEVLKAHSNAQDKLHTIEQRAKQGEATDLRSALLELWIQYTDSVNATLGQCFRALLEIGAANPEYVSSDPSHWASEFLRPHVSDIVTQAEHGVLPKYTALLDDKEETVASLLTEFYVEIINALT